jgi:hypothetical protein
MERRICVLLLSLFVVVGLTDSASAQRGRRARRYVAATVARANAQAALFYAPGFYPPVMPPLFVPPLAGVAPPASPPFGLYLPRPRAVVNEPSQLGSERGVFARSPGEDASLPRSSLLAPPQAVGPELRAPEQSSVEDGLSPAEAVPPPPGELKAPLQKDPELRARRGLLF